MTRRIGILGGTFDPIHVGHLGMAAAAEHALGLTSVMLMPARVPPHRQAPAVSPFHRFAMVSLAICGRNDWAASDMELTEPTRSYTSATLDRLHALGYGARELYFLIGADAFRDIASWKDYPGILEKANFAVVARPGSSIGALGAALPDLATRMGMPDGTKRTSTVIVLIDVPTADVSASAIRQRLSRGETIDDLVPSSVAQHIARHGLYTAAASDRRRDDRH